MKVFILSGVPGSGKSTWVSKLDGRVVVCSADDYFIDERTGLYNFNPAKLGEAHIECFAKYNHFVSRAEHIPGDIVNPDYVVVDNTNLRLEHITPYVMLAKIFNRPFEIIRFKKDVTKILDRNIHGVPLQKVLDMDHQSLRLKFPADWTVRTITED